MRFGPRGATRRFCTLRICTLITRTNRSAFELIWWFPYICGWRRLRRRAKVLTYSFVLRITGHFSGNWCDHCFRKLLRRGPAHFELLLNGLDHLDVFPVSNLGLGGLILGLNLEVSGPKIGFTSESERLNSSPAFLWIILSLFLWMYFCSCFDSRSWWLFGYFFEHTTEVFWIFFDGQGELDPDIANLVYIRL